MKDELGGKIMIKFVEFTAKTYSYLRDDVNEDKKKAQKSVSKKENLTLKIIKTV